MYLISLYFDEKTNRTLSRLIHKIADQTGNTFMTDHNVPPHMTISSIEARSPEALLPAFQSLEGKLQKGSIRIVTVGQLLPYVFYASPVLNSYLQEMTETIYEVIKDIPETTVSKVYRPYQWLPHITLGKTLTREQMQLAFQVAQENFQPITATVEKNRTG